ncbi:hypothetical protein ANCCAN_09927 [Ancylostoma caninum]|uniref:Uncharacterized protein n=1 Tax=Ancylostoma caninum TaxID=29170 RepID=A0A368GI61_ANCCA|nr:hypothetical protein ANCCAN_09927 [Ancylostoma caninum]
MDAKAQRKAERRRAGRSGFDRYDAPNAERKGGVLEIKNSSRGWGPRSSRGNAADEKEKAKGESANKDAAKEGKDDGAEPMDHLARLFANAKKVPAANEPREKKPSSGKFDKQTAKPRRERGRGKPENTVDKKEDGGEKAETHKAHDDTEAKGTMGLDPLKKVPPPKRDPAERQRRREGQASRPVKKPSERLLAALGAATASSRSAAASSAGDFKSKKYSERNRRKDEQGKDEDEPATATNAS